VKYHGFRGWMLDCYLVDSLQPVPDPVDPDPKPAPDPEPEPAILIDDATVWSDNGKPVKVRQKPSIKCNLYDEVPVGTVLAVDAYNCTTDAKGNQWSKVTTKNRNGWYIMTKFLSVG
jgi:hypothetical protein